MEIEFWGLKQIKVPCETMVSLINLFMIDPMKACKGAIKKWEEYGPLDIKDLEIN